MPALRLLPALSGAVLAVAALLSLAGGASAQIVITPEQWQALLEDIERIKQDNTALRVENERLRSDYQSVIVITRDLQAQLQSALVGVVPDDDFYIPRVANQFAATRQPEYFGNEYTKPFLRDLGSNVYIGGYIDLEFIDPGDDGGDRFFDQHRLVPLVYADVSDQVKVSAEVEVEHGHELEVEFAQIDYLVNDAVNLRGGIQLLPLGKLNQVHDSPIQDLTARPLVDTYIIPTTLRDAGLGVHGRINEQVSYAATVTNGFKGLKADGTNVITSKKGLRDAAPHKGNDALDVEPFEQINDDLAYTGRVAYTPVLGVEAGASALFDNYDEAGDNDLAIYALDLTVDGKAVPFLPDNTEFLYEGAWADIQRNDFARMSGVPGNMHGYYAQLNVHFEPPFLDGLKQAGDLDEAAHFTFVTRYGMVDLDTYEMQRTTFGLNFRPNASDTVFKLDLQLNDDSGEFAGSADDPAVLFSMATYF